MRETIGIRRPLGEVLAEHGISQTKLAQESGVSISSIRALSKPGQYGRTGTSKATAIDISRALATLTGRKEWEMHAILWDFDPLQAALAHLTIALDILTGDEITAPLGDIIEHIAGRCADAPR